jgi:hypothetical protein
MRALKIVTVAMGILIVAATALLAVLIIRRITPPGPTAPVALHEPPGTRIAGIAGASSGAVVVWLQGGGPDRLVLLDPHTLHPTATLAVTPPLP